MSFPGQFTDRLTSIAGAILVLAATLFRKKERERWQTVFDRWSDSWEGAGPDLTGRVRLAFGLVIEKSSRAIDRVYGDRIVSPQFLVSTVSCSLAVVGIFDVNIRSAMGPPVLFLAIGTLGIWLGRRAQRVYAWLVLAFVVVSCWACTFRETTMEERFVGRLLFLSETVVLTALSVAWFRYLVRWCRRRPSFTVPVFAVVGIVTIGLLFVLPYAFAVVAGASIDRIVARNIFPGRYESAAAVDGADMIRSIVNFISLTAHPLSMFAETFQYWFSAVVADLIPALPWIAVGALATFWEISRLLFIPVMARVMGVVKDEQVLLQRRKLVLLVGLIFLSVGTRGSRFTVIPLIGAIFDVDPGRIAKATDFHKMSEPASSEESVPEKK